MSPAARTRPVSRGRRAIAGTMMAVATIVAFLAIVSVWTNRLLLNPDNWASTSGQLLDRPAVRQAAAEYAVGKVYADAKLHGVVADALRPVAERAVQASLQTPAVKTVWEQANGLAGEALVAVVNGHEGPVGLEDGVVSLDISKVVKLAAKQLGISSTVTLPANAQRIEIMRSDQLKTVQVVARILRPLPVVLVPLALVLYALALLIAPRSRRRRTLMAVGLSLVTAGLLALLMRWLMVSQIPGALTSGTSNVAAVHDVVDVITQMLGTDGRATALLGAVLVVGSWLAGLPRLMASRRRFAR